VIDDGAGAAGTPESKAGARPSPRWSVAAFAAGAAFAVLSFGAMALDPGAVQWLLISDRGQAFLGWHMVRHAKHPFALPLGSIPDYVAPHGASLALTDSVPWFSLLLLPLSPLLPSVFQHAGIWLVLCYGLMALFSFRLLLRLSSDPLTSFVATLLVVINPVLLFRRFHLSLCAHWMIVATLLLYAAPLRGGVARERTMAALLLVLAAGTHPYLTVMVLGLVGAAAWARSRSWQELGASWLLYLVTSAVALWAFGYLGHADLAAPGFGEFSANLLALVDPDGWSRVVPDVPSGPGEYEGFGFLGVGVLLVISADLALLLRDRATRRPVTPPRSGPRVTALLVVVAAFTTFALASHVRLGDRELIDLSRPYALLAPLPSILRASGRFVWPLYYVVVFAALASLRRRTSRAGYVAIVLLALCAQLADGWPRYATQDVALMALTNPYRPLRAPAWRRIGADYREIRLIPPAVVDTVCDEGSYPRFHYMPWAFVAGREGMRINSGHLSRYAGDVAARCREQTDAVLAGRLEPEVVYVLSPAALAASGLGSSRSARCGILDGNTVCVAAGRDTDLARALAGGLR
jgi:hypothetical protein